MIVRRIEQPAEASQACGNLIGLLPDWFGIPESNAAYVSGVAECTCFGAFDAAGECQGLIALRQHFITTLEIWWMAVAPDHHRTGIGAALMAAAKAEAVRSGCTDMVLMTLGEEGEDAGYDATRRFYFAQGFRPLVNDHMTNPECPMIWMICRIEGIATLATKGT